jgi:hypothetical protein
MRGCSDTGASRLRTHAGAPPQPVRRRGSSQPDQLPDGDPRATARTEFQHYVWDRLPLVGSLLGARQVCKSAVAAPNAGPSPPIHRGSCPRAAFHLAAVGPLPFQQGWTWAMFSLCHAGSRRVVPPADTASFAFCNNPPLTQAPLPGRQPLPCVPPPPPRGPAALWKRRGWREAAV